jgi:hypothetical protein
VNTGQLSVMRSTSAVQPDGPLAVLAARGLARRWIIG